MPERTALPKYNPNDGSPEHGRVHGRFPFRKTDASLLGADPEQSAVRGNPDWRELKEHEHKAVVRVFLYQARSPEMIPDDVEPKDMNFVDMINIKKGPGNNEGQVMPVGGKVDDNEELATAIRREVVEETHLRAIPNSIIPFGRIQNYSFKHESKQHGGTTQKRRRAYFYQGHLLPHPHDIPYVLDPQEDNIANFERLSFEQAHRLFADGKVTTEHGEVSVLDSLNLDEATRSEHRVIADEDDIHYIQTEALVRLQLGNCEKKMQILAQLMGAYRTPATKWSIEVVKAMHLKDKVEKAIYSQSLDVTSEELSELIREVSDYWAEQVVKHGWSNDTVKKALELANARYTINHAAEHFDMDRGRGVPTVSMMFPLLFEGKFSLKDMGRYRIILENPQAKKLLELSQVLYLYHQYTAEEGKDAAVEAKLRSRLKLPEGDIDFDAVQDWMYASGHLDKRARSSYEVLAPTIDKYFEILQREARVTDRSIDQANEVKGKTIETIIARAFGEDPTVITGDNEYDRLVRWEAQRKLLLIQMMHEASAFRNQILKRGIEPVDALEKQLEAEDSKADGRKLELNGVVYNVSIETRTKELLSLLRKLIVRDRLAPSDDLVGDTFAEAIIFNDEKADYNEATFTPDCIVTDENGQILDQVVAPAVVRDYIQELALKARESGEQITIAKFKGLPQAGEGFKSEGAGGGAAVRMCKFYIQHRDAKGALRQREVQLFVPNQVDGEWVPGQVDYDAKKHDDAEYAVRRLFSTKALRSFMELLFPAEIYGDAIQPIYKSRVK